MEQHQVQHTGVARFQYTKFAESTLVQLPSPLEQRAIARVLGSLEDKIELNRRMNKTLEDLAATIFRAWFVDFESVRAKMAGRQPAGMDAATAAFFPGRLVDSELGEIPEGWRVGSVYEIAQVVYGAAFKSSFFNTEGNGLPLIRIRDLAEQSPQIYTDEVLPKAYKIRAGDIVVGMDGEFQAAIWLGADSWLNQRVCCFVPRTPNQTTFVAESIRPWLAFFERAKTGTTVIHLGKADIDTFTNVIPSPDVLEAFGQLTDSLVQKQIINHAQNQTLAELRDTLLPRLLSGDLRVPEEMLTP